MWGMTRAQAKGAAGIVMDVDTGEVMALASLPSFNPNALRPQDISDSDPTKQANIFNRATNQTYELGSVMKPITVASAIEHATAAVDGIAAHGYSLEGWLSSLGMDLTWR